jgi:hypothetical protein
LIEYINMLFDLFSFSDLDESEGNVRREVQNPGVNWAHFPTYPLELPRFRVQDIFYSYLNYIEKFTEFSL